ncbi:hypothetical protein B0J17DRAFT_747322 [Rhizoctonia solani]|nr:hypothetical protein B0J17DRAFT_747322 [Rhizoctonia solani]
MSFSQALMDFLLTHVSLGLSNMRSPSIRHIREPFKGLPLSWGPLGTLQISYGHVAQLGLFLLGKRIDTRRAAELIRNLLKSKSMVELRLRKVRAEPITLQGIWCESHKEKMYTRDGRQDKLWKDRHRQISILNCMSAARVIGNGNGNGRLCAYPSIIALSSIPFASLQSSTVVQLTPPPAGWLSDIMPLNTHFFAPSPIKALSSQLPNISSNYSFNRSKDIHDYRQRTRIEFPGGWSHESDPIIQWYQLQPYFEFQSIEYRKEREGVRHEYILVFLQDADGNLVKSYCRLERVADPAHRMEAIGVNGTTAFDFIQTIDSNDPETSAQVNVDAESELVARITFPRVFGLGDILGICYGIYSHPRARRYTLQQFNCYFFSWTIILCLARRTADWESAIKDGINEIQEAVIKHVENLRSARMFTAWSLIFRVHNESNTPTHPNVVDRFLSKISSEHFLNLASELLCPLLWHDQDSNYFRCTLAKIFGGTTGELASPLLDDLMIQDESAGLGLHRPELARICVIVYHKLLCDEEHVQEEIRDRRLYYAECVKQASRDSRMRMLKFQVGARLAVLDPHQLIFVVSRSINLSWNVYDQKKATLCGAGRWTSLQKSLSIAKATLHAPQSLYTSLIHEIRTRRLIYYHTLTAYIHDNHLQAPNVHCFPTQSFSELFIDVLNESIRIYSERYPTKDNDALRRAAVKAIQYFYATNHVFNQSVIGDGNMASLWKVSLGMDLGGVVSQTIVENIIRPTSGTLIRVDSLTEVTSNRQDRPSSESRCISHTEIQNILRENISRLSKREVEHAPIAQYVLRLPFMTPAKDIQEGIESAIQEIWGGNNRFTN